MNHSLLFLCSAVLLCSCHVKNRIYNPAPNSIVALSADIPQPDCDPQKTGCVAFVEFDDMGEYWQRDRFPAQEPKPGEPDTRVFEPRQLTRAIELIRKAKHESKTPIIVTFVHGWKNNAALDNGNVVGFEGVLEFIKKTYDLPVVGIYIGWRGDLISKYWPIRRQLSYFNREGAAIRIPGASMTETFARIMLEAHSGEAGSGTQLIMVGHSFGALVLERALTQALTGYIVRSRGTSTRRRQEDAIQSRLWADLVVFVNSAAAASEGKQMLNLLKESAITYQSKLTRAEDVYHRTPDRPLLVSISSLGDAATRFALPIGHGLSYLNRATKGSWRSYTPADPPEVPSQGSYYLSTTAHMQALQSHVIVEVKDAQGAKPCDVPYADSFTITTGQRYQICEKSPRWNDTPYFAMQMPATIVPYHGGIFNENFIRLLRQFLPSVDEMRREDDRPALAPKASLPARQNR